VDRIFVLGLRLAVLPLTRQAVLPVCRYDGIMAETQKLTVVLDADLMKRFRIQALREGKSVTMIVREFVAWYVQKGE
jgi:hypothetical protein